jgi:cyclopropane fatty-acyl-phospholipid synthase-like methyltransferase
MYDLLQSINHRPKPYEVYTAEMLWNDRHISKQLLACHLDQTTEWASRNLPFIDKSVDWMTARFQIGENTKICDFGCGPGLYTSRFASKGAEVSGIDFSQRSLQYAEETAAQKGLNIDYRWANYLNVSMDKQFDLITMIYCDFCALSPEQRKILLGQFYNYLNEEGSVILDVYSLNSFKQREEMTYYEYLLMDGFWSEEDYYGFLNVFKYEDEKVVLDKYTIVEKMMARKIYNWLQYFSQESLREEFETNGFTISEYYSDVAGTPYREDGLEMTIVAKKQ